MMFMLTFRMLKKKAISDFDHVRVVGARQTGLSIFITGDLLQFFPPINL